MSYTVIINPMRCNATTHREMFTNCYNSGLMVGPGNLIAEVGDIKTDFAHAIDFRIMFSPIVNLFKRSVPIVIKLWAIVF